MTVIGDLLIEFTERRPTGEEPPVLTLTEKNGFVRQSERFNKRLATDDTGMYKLVRRNDIAFNPYLLWAGAVAQNTIVDGGIISPLYPTFRVREGWDPRYVARMLLTPQMIGAYDGIAFGSVPRRRRSSVKDFLALPIQASPLLEEQRRIARILDQADTLRAKRRQTLAHLDELTQSIFLEMFGPALDCTVPLGHLVEEFRYGTSNKSQPEGYPTLRIPNVIGGGLNTDEIKRVPVESAELRRLLLHDGDLLFVRTNGNQENVGRCAVFEQQVMDRAGFDGEPTLYASYLIRARLHEDRARPEFVKQFLATAAGRTQLRERSKTSAGQYNINTDALRSIEVPNVTVTDQLEFEARLRSVVGVRTAVRAASAADGTLFMSLQQQCFAGRR